MDCSKILLKYYSELAWICGETYETLEWNDTTISKPTEEELDLKYDELLLDEMREKRNQLLKESDFRALPDYPDTNKEAWILYRHNLRTLPETWVEGMNFPIPPPN